ncbi:DUF6454 family protein [Novosphingobium sp. JCM 18896]|uniref:DUF6454 family protein n=1 Tax=Novosphingobium sp. JCM 18896 TaxID=2989731 RepID=UPI0022229302|nr:DUF6454 family protein [Novosphingobium sp. JCM 18896]MCW1430548.1 DUF6454 family protein [Novosphingobium sp. JCM 18896]
MTRNPLKFGATALLLVLWSLSVAAAPDRPDADWAGSGIENARLQGTLKLDGEVFHVQGLELDARRIWLTSVDQANRKGYLHLFDRTSGKLLRRIELTDGARYHPGGISRSGRSLWIPVAEMRPDSSAVLIELDADSLRLSRKIRVADHLGCVAASGHILVAGNWDSRMFYVIDLAAPGRVRKLANPSPTHHQDIKFVGDQLVAAGNLSLWSGTVDWIDWPSMRLRRTLRAGAIGPVRPFGRGGPLTGEGMTIDGRDLYVVPEDGPSRLFRYRLDV